MVSKNCIALPEVDASLPRATAFILMKKRRLASAKDMREFG
jgi:hypothetical protein